MALSVSEVTHNQGLVCLTLENLMWFWFYFFLVTIINPAISRLVCWKWKLWSVTQLIKKDFYKKIGSICVKTLNRLVPMYMRETAIETLIKMKLKTNWDDLEKLKNLPTISGKFFVPVFAATCWSVTESRGCFRHS